MRILHLSDLHLGKRVNEFPMIEEQAYILERILEIADDEQPAAVVIAGDVYDKAVPPAEAVQLFDEFLYQLAKRGLHVFVISGNHDSPERIAFGARLMDQSGIHVSPVYNGTVSPVSLEDEYGTVNVYMLPFVRSAQVRRYFEQETIETYTDAVRAAVSHMDITDGARNLLVTHQFVTGARRCDSEEISVGGTDNVDSSVFEPFDYVALGHLHGPQSVGRETVRYCGTPLKYSFSEKDHIKSVTVADIRGKGDLTVRTVPLKPARDLREIRGTYMELTARENYAGTRTDDYLHVILTDEYDVPDAMSRLRTIYPNIMKLDYDNTRTRTAPDISAVDRQEQKTPFELFAEFYEKQNGRPMTEEQAQFSMERIEEIWRNDG